MHKFCGKPSFTDVPEGKDRLGIRQNLPGSNLGTSPSAEQTKPSNGGVTKGPATSLRIFSLANVTQIVDS